MKKGILSNSRRSVNIENASTFSVDLLNRTRITLGDDVVNYMTLQDEQKAEVLPQLNAEAETFYRALNGEVRLNKSIGSFLKNSLNAGTFSSVFTPAIELFMADYHKPAMVASAFLATTVPVGPSLNKSLIQIVRSFGMIKVKEVAKGGPLPIVNPNLADYTDQTAYDIKRWGCKLEIDKDLRNSDEFGVLGFLLTQLSDAFLYRKEVEVIKMVNTIGEVMYDNANPANGTFGVTTEGRGINGTFNGTVILSDLMRVFGYANARGVTPRYIVVHPYALLNFVGDSEMSQLLGAASMVDGRFRQAFQPGWDTAHGDLGYMMRYYGGSQFYDSAGNPLAAPTTAPYSGGLGMGPLGKLGVDTFNGGLNYGTSGYFMGSANIPGMNIQVIALPQVPLKQVTVGGNTRMSTNMYVVGDRTPVAILQQSGPAPMEWEDIEKEIEYMGFVEKYTTVPLFQGRGVYTIKNVVIDKNYTNFQGQYTVAALTEPGAGAVVS